MPEKNETPLLSPKFALALQFANEIHGTQQRKGLGAPYISHLMAVSASVLEHGGNEAEAIAALLHDAAEDCGGLPMLDGDIQYLGRSIKGRGAWDLVAEGLAMVPEGRGVFARMTITENLQMGAYVRNDKPEIAADIEKMFVLFPRLRERKDQLAGTMSGGEQQMLAMGRALMSRPKVLLLDEPSMGLSPIMVDKIFEVIRDVSALGMTVLLVEQNASRALGIANRGYVMESGHITMNGDAKLLLDDPRVRAAYLGE